MTDPALWYGIGVSLVGIATALWWRVQTRRIQAFDDLLQRVQRAEALEKLEEEREAAQWQNRQPSAPQDPIKEHQEDPVKEYQALQQWFADPMFSMITANIRLMNERVLVGTRKTGERCIGVLIEESQVPTDSVNIRPIQSVDELTRVLPVEWAMDEDIFDIRLAQGEILVQVPMQYVPLMEDVHEPVYEDVVHTVYVLLDISNSMFPHMMGVPWRMPVWKGLTLKVMFDAIRAKATFTLRPFSNRPHDARRIVNELQALDLAKLVVGLRPGGGTDILAALQSAIADFSKMTYDTADIIIITDGEDETELAQPLRDVLDQNQIKLHAVMLGTQNKSLRACCDSYQIVDETAGVLKLHPVVTRVVQSTPVVA